MDRGSRCDSTEASCSLRQQFVSTRTRNEVRWPASARHRSCLGANPPGPGQLMVKRCSVMTVSSAPRAPLRRGTRRDSRVDKDHGPGQRAQTSCCTATVRGAEEETCTYLSNDCAMLHTGECRETERGGEAFLGNVQHAAVRTCKVARRLTEGCANGCRTLSMEWLAFVWRLSTSTASEFGG